jgi:hypothetical protein
LFSAVNRLDVDRVSVAHIECGYARSEEAERFRSGLDSARSVGDWGGVANRYIGRTVTREQFRTLEVAEDLQPEGAVLVGNI